MRTALVVENDPTFVEVEIELLQSAGILVEVVESGEEARERLQSAEYDVVILNQSLAGTMTGADVFSWLEGARRNLPTVILVTGKLMRNQSDSQPSTLVRVLHRGPFMRIVEKALAATTGLN